jgi:hypothetical protein
MDDLVATKFFFSFFLLGDLVATRFFFFHFFMLDYKGQPGGHRFIFLKIRL